MRSDIYQITHDWPCAMQLALDDYIERHGMEHDRLLRVDLVLILLRLADSAAPGSGLREDYLERVAELTGKAITRCPSAMPPWPPKPVERRLTPYTERLTHFRTPNPCVEGTSMAAHYALLKLGMTREQMLARGITVRDIRYWKKLGHITMSEQKGETNAA